jgi:hypothetical protein
MNYRIYLNLNKPGATFCEDNISRMNCPALPILAMLLTTIRKLVGRKLVMATDDERAVQFEEFRKQFFSDQRGMIFSGK